MSSPRSRGPSRLRRLGVLSLSTLAAVALVMSTMTGLAAAADPSSGVVSESSPNTSWQGASYLAQSTPVPELCPPDTDVGNVQCDHFFLTIDVAADFWDRHSGGVTIRIEWPDSGNDFDLYVYNSDGFQVDSSAAGGTTSEEVFLELPVPGVYEVRVVPFLVVNSAYTGSAVLSFTPGPPVPNPTHGTGGIAFAPSTIVDAQRTEGEPIVHVDQAGNIWESGPWGTSTTQSFVHKSTDAGNSFHVVSPIDARPDLPPGGGDTDVVTDDQGFAYFVDLEALAELGTAVSNDGGNTWRKNTAGVPSTAVDRQWFAMDNGPTSGADDNTVFLTVHQVPLGMEVFSSPGSTGIGDPTGGLVFVNAADAVTVGDGATCGQTKFDPVLRNLYLPCVRDDHVEVIRGHVPAGVRTGISFKALAAPTSPGGVVGDLFANAAVDRAGNLYVAWVDASNHNVYVSGSKDGGDTWSKVLQVNGHPSNTNVWPWIVGGASGIVDVVWYGTEVRGDPDAFPSWFANRPAAAGFPWYAYFAQVRFDFKSPPRSTIYQVRASEHPMHFGQICQGGIGCTLSNGDRSMADFFAVTVDAAGAAIIVYDDTTNQHHGAADFAAKQVAGPGAFGTPISRTVPANPVADPAGDAQFPHYAPSGPGLNQPAADLTTLQLSQPNADTLRVRMRVANAESLVPTSGADAFVWLTRWQFLSVGDGGEASYRLFYAGAKSVGGADPTFFSGTGTSADPTTGAMGNGCITNTPQNCKLILYPEEQTETGSLDRSRGDFVINVPLAHIGLPIAGDTLFSVTALSLGQVGVDPSFQDIDATPAFDFVLTKGGAGVGKRVTGGGSIATDSGGEGRFTVLADSRLHGKIAYVDKSSPAVFRSAHLSSVVFDGTKVTIMGTGFVNGMFTQFRVVVEDLSEPGVGGDTFSIELMATGYHQSGKLIRGNIQVH